MVALVALLWTHFVCAQNSTSTLQQYKRAEWGPEQGLSSGRVQALAQTPDGYLWIGTAQGLLRFDGVRFVPILIPQKQPLPQILGLTVDKDGVLWSRAGDTRLRKVQIDGISPPVSLKSHFLGIVVTAAAQATGIYATSTDKSVLRLTKNRVDPLPIHLHTLLISLAEAKDGRLWIGTDRGLLYWDGVGLSTVSAPNVNQKINCLLSDEGGHVWVGSDDGLAYWDGRNLVQRPFGDKGMQHLHVLTIMKDTDGNLWIGTSKGLLRYNSIGAVWVSMGPHSDRPPVTALLQDREGDIWFGSGSSLQKLETTPIIPVRLNDSTVNGGFGPLYVDPRGRVWFAEGQHGLFWMEHGVIHPVYNDDLSRDEAYSIDGAGNDIWVGRRSGGLTRLRFGNGALESKTWKKVDGLSQNSAFVVRVASNGNVWIGTLTGGLNLFTDGRFKHFGVNDGLPADDISAIEVGSQGQVWVGTSGGVCEMHDHRCVPLSPPLEPAGRDVLSLYEDPSSGLWVGTSHGLFFVDDHGQHAVSLREGTQPRILGMSFDKSGRLWMTSDRSVMSAMPAQLLGLKHPSVRLYGNDDGLQYEEGVHRSRSVVTDGGGRVWLTTASELAMIGNNPAPLPIVIPHVEQVSADGTLLDRNDAEVSSGTKRLSFSFTGLDLHAPSRIRFRYRLDDFEKNWSDPTSDREATYTNLAPGTYTFRLIASNETNSWTSQESTVHVVIEPGIWQRWSIRFTLAAIFVLLIALAYQTRTRFLLSRANILADERLRERTRIARDVHDTLLQGFISSSMHLHVAEMQSAIDSPLKQKLAFVLEGMDRVIEEARLAVVGLRTPESGHGSIESGLRDFFQEIADLGDSHITLHSLGRARRLKAEACEQISSIAKEAILNAVRHASPRMIRVEVSWGWIRLRVSVMDDGCGMDTYTAEHGRAQHWGLVGMRERAMQLKAQLLIKSSPGAGTKVTLKIPATVAYRGHLETKRPADHA